jgi:cystathionine beta-lyase/cystathionine gamma-synthase
VHAGEDRHGRHGPLTTEITQTSVFVLPRLEHLRRYNAGEPGLYLYTRYGNPTVGAAEQKIAALEGAEDCVVTASGMAATLTAILSVCSEGDEIVCMLDVYGGTLKLLKDLLSRFGIDTRLVSFRDLEKLDTFFSPKTRMLFLESPTNPTLRCVDLEKLAQIGHQHKACVVVDNTFATPVLQKPLAFGADIVIHSGTKYLGGHNDVTCGAIVGRSEWITPARGVMLQTGGCLDPSAAYLLIRGMKTLEIRIERASTNAARIADWLARHPKVARVMYPGLPTNDGHEVACRQMHGFGTVVSFEIRGGGEAAERFIDSLQLWYLAASLGGVESTVSYPLLSSHLGLTKEWLQLMDVSAATIRLSVGIEDWGDLVVDLDQALSKA